MKHNNKNVGWSALVAGAVMLGSSAHAETRQDPAGQVGQDLLQQEQRRKDKVRQIKLPAITEQEEVTEGSEDEGPFFQLNGIRFTKSAHLTREELQGIVQPWIGTEVSYQTLQTLLKNINQLYRSKNIYTAVAVFPEQQIDNGVVAIRLVEGSIGEVVVEGNDYTKDDYFRQWLGYEDHEDGISVDNLERDILFYNRLHDQQLQAELRAGKAFGLTDIVINLPSQLSRNTFNVYADNYGYESTGVNQLSALYQRQQLFRPGDKALAYALASKGLKSFSTSYSTVVGRDGWRLGGTLQYTDTEIKEGDFSPLDAVGNTIRYGLESGYLAYSTPDAWVNFLGSVSHTESENEFKREGEKFTKFRTVQYRLGAELNWLGDQWQFSGRLLYNAVNSKDKLAKRNGNKKLTFWSPRATFIYNFNNPFYALSVLEFQLTSNQGIPGAVSFSLGGPSTLRGYKPGIVSGDKGWYQQIELHYNGFSYNEYQFDLFGFYDHGKVESLNPAQSLASAGAGLRITGGEWLSLDLTAASALRSVVPDQKKSRVYARLTCTCLD